MSKIQDKFDLTGKTAIVTGGIGLLGREFCRTLCEAGAFVIVADIDAEKSETYSIELRSAGYQAGFHGVDVTNPKSVQEMVAKAVKGTNRLDILVNSAAMDPKFDVSQSNQSSGGFEEFPLDIWRTALDVNLTGMFLCCQAAAGQMVGQGEGSIINICSTYGLAGPDQRIYNKAGQPKRYKPVYYSVTKAGVLGLTRYLATYYAGTKIRSNALTPGGV